MHGFVDMGEERDFCCVCSKKMLRTSVVKGAVTLVALAITILVGIVSNPDLSDLARPSWQPSNAAFSIWGLIYTGIAVGGVAQLFPSVADRVDPWSTAMLCASLVSSAAWLLSVRRAVEFSVVCIVTAFLTALIALVVNTPLREPCNVADRLVSLGPALLTGWLSLAAPLGVNLAVMARGGKELPGWVVLPSSLTAAVVGGTSGTPEVGAALMWAALFSTSSNLSKTLGVVGFVSALAAIARSVAAETGGG